MTEDQGKVDHWGLLASSLGAPPSSSEEKPKAAPRKEEETAPARENAGVSSAFASRAPQARRAVGDWDRLAGDLGIEARESAPPAPQPSSSRRAEPPAFQELSPPFQPLGTPEELFSEIADEHGEAEETPADAVAEPRGRREDRGDREDREEEPRRGRRRRGRRRRGRGEDRPAGERDEEPSAETRLHESRECVEESEEEEEEVAAAPASAEAEGEEEQGRRRGRRRRRRRGGGGREEGGERGERRETAKPRSESGRNAPARVEDDVESDHDDMDHDDEAGDKSLHRAIPSWQEAVGMVIDANMESRAKNPDRGRHHGRQSRGGRDRRR